MNKHTHYSNLGPVPTSKNQAHGTGPQLAKAFTLVELIVVITILAILGTIAFISLQGYSADARDSVRISDLSNIDLQLEMYLIKGTKLPIPDEAITLESKGVIVGYQGYIGEGILNTIGVHGGGKDPLDDSYYTYRINGTKTTYQVMGFLEDGTEISLNLLNQTNAADLTKRYPTTKGKTIGILLEQTTNKPLQQIETGTVDLRNNTTNVDMYLSTTTKIPGTPQTLYGTIETLALNQNFIEPKECPTGFIPIPGNRDLGQPAFCVAKYEMTYADADTPNSTGGGTDFNTVAYILTKIPVSIPGKYPIADIIQGEAINACKSMGDGYHLITNNEWMTIARNIEQQPINWNGGVVGQNFINNGVSYHITMGCDIDLTGNTGRRRGSVTGDNNCTDIKNKLTLSNGEEIWDFAGNVWENTNKSNTINGADYGLGQTSITGTSSGTSIDDNGIYSIEDMKKFGSINNYGLNMGMGNVRYSDGVPNNVSFRGGSANNYSTTGIFAIHLSSNYLGGRHRAIGFRCAK